MKPKLKPPGTKRLKLKCDILLSTSAFKFNLRRYSQGREVHKQCQACHIKNRPSQHQGEFKCNCGASFDISEETRAAVMSKGREIYMLCTPCRIEKFEKDRCQGEFKCNCGKSFDISKETRAQILSKGHEVLCKECHYANNDIAKGPFPCINTGCNGTFVILVGELAGLKSKNHSAPTRCAACREYKVGRCRLTLSNPR